MEWYEIAKKEKKYHLRSLGFQMCKGLGPSGHQLGGHPHSREPLWLWNHPNLPSCYDSLHYTECLQLAL